MILIMIMRRWTALVSRPLEAPVGGRGGAPPHKFRRVLGGAATTPHPLLLPAEAGGHVGLWTATQSSPTASQRFPRALPEHPQTLPELPRAALGHQK